MWSPTAPAKTTLLKMMAGIDELDSGAILKPSAMTVGYLPQDGLAHAGRSVFDEASSAFADLLAMKTEMHALEDGWAMRPFRKPNTTRCRAVQRSADRFRLGDGVRSS